MLVADALIVATGAQARWLNLPWNRNLRVMASPPAPRVTALYRGEEVLVIGGGNTATEETLFLTNSRPR